MSELLFNIVDLSGGINQFLDPKHVPPGEFVYIYNIYTQGRAKKVRSGYAEHNSADSAALTIQQLSSFINSAGNWHLIAQCSNGNIYQNTYRPPGATGIFTATAVFAQSTGYFPMFTLEWKGQFILTNGINNPQIWGGRYPYVTNFKRAIGGDFTDYTVQVTDGLSSTYAAPGALWSSSTYTGSGGISTEQDGYTQGSDQVAVGAPCYIGTATSGGTYSGSDVNPIMRVEMVTAGALATSQFKYRINTGAGFGALTGAAVTTAAAGVAADIVSGMTIKFANTGTNTALVETNLLGTGDGTNVVVSGFASNAWTAGDTIRFNDDGSTRQWLIKTAVSASGTLTFQDGGSSTYPNIADDVQDGQNSGALTYTAKTWQEGGSGVDYTNDVQDGSITTFSPWVGNATYGEAKNVAPAATRITLLKFDLSSLSGVTITSASLQVYAAIESASSTLYAHQYLGKALWSEANPPTWAECDTSATDYAAAAEGSVAVTSAIYSVKSLTVTNTIQAQINGTCYGIWLTAADNALVYILLSEHATATYRPKLTVTYTTPGSWANVTLISAGYSLGEYRSALDFPLLSWIPGYSTISSATLTLTKYYAWGVGNVACHALLNDLADDATGIAYTSMDTSATDYTAVASDTKDITGATFAFDVTSIVQAIVNGTAYGFLLIGPSSGTNMIQFYSSEFGTVASRPKLAVTITAKLTINEGCRVAGAAGAYGAAGAVATSFTQVAGALPGTAEISVDTRHQVGDFWDIAISTDVKYLYACYYRPFAGLKFTIATGYYNSKASVCTPKYWNGIAWTSCAAFADGTVWPSSTVSMNITGDMTWTKPTASVERSLAGVPGHWIRLEWSEAMTSTLRIESVQVIDEIESIPDTWDGNLLAIAKAYTLVGTTYTNAPNIVLYTGENALDSFAATSRVMIGVNEKAKGFYLTAGTAVNSDATVMTVEFWNGEDWQSVGTIQDGTIATAGKSLGQSGYVYWGNVAEDQPTKVISDDTAARYWYRIGWSIALDADCDLATVEYIPQGDPPLAAKCCALFANRLWLMNFPEDGGMIRCSAAYETQVWSGDDVTTEYTNEHKDIQAGAACDRYLMIYCEDAIEYIFGQTLDDFEKRSLITEGVGLTAPHSLVTVGKLQFFFHASGFYMIKPGSEDYAIDVACVSENAEKKTGITQLVRDLNPSYYSNMRGVYNKKYNRIEWFVTRYPGQTTNNFVYVLELDTMGWTVFEMAQASAVGIVGSDGYPYIITGGINNWKLYQQDSGTTDAGSTIYSQLLFPKLDAGKPQSYKKIHLLKAQLDIESAGTVDVSTYKDEAATPVFKKPALDLTDVNKQRVWVNECCYTIQPVLSSDDAYTIRAIQGFGDDLYGLM